MAATVSRVFVPLALAVALAGCSRPAGGLAPSPSAAALDPARPLPSPVPDVVARVNGQPILIRQILPMAKVELDRVPDAERDRRKPEVLRHALQRYVDRELLVQAALARGLQADARDVEWAYDQMRREHGDEAAWTDFLAEQGMDAQSVRAELRVQHTLAALLDAEVSSALGGQADEALRRQKRPEVEAALLARLRARARIDLFL